MKEPEKRVSRGPGAALTALLGVGAAALVSACASSPPPAPLMTAAEASARLARARAADALAGGHPHTVVMPALGAPRMMARDDEGAVLLAVGGARVRVLAGRAEVAAVPFASELAAAGRTAQGWWFVTSSGSVSRASDFLARPERVTGPSEAATIRALAEGRREELARNASQTEPAVAAIAARAALERFSSARLAFGSTILLTGPSLVFVGSDSLQWARVRGESFGVVSRAELPADARSNCEGTSFGERVLWQCPMTVPTDARGGATDAGPWWRVWSVGPEGVEAWAGAVPGRALAGRDGRTATYPGPCMGGHDRPTSEGTSGEPGARACTHDRTRGWRDWEYPRPGRVLDVYDDLALVAEQRDGATGLYLYEIDGARVSEVLLSEPAAEVQRAGFTSDGSVLVLARVGSAARARSAAGVARPGRPVLLQPLGYFARDISMGDARRGMAVGATAGEVSVTTDGGLTWTSAIAALDGDASRVALPEVTAATAGQRTAGARRTGELVECGSVACRAGARLVHHWEEPAATVSAAFE